MNLKRMSALIMSVMMCFALIPSYVLAANDVTFTAIDGTGEKDSKEGYGKLIDGNISTKWGVNKPNNPYIVIKASKSIVLDGYTFVTGDDNATHNGRNPKDWVIYGCNNYDETNKTGTWTQILSVSDDTTLTDTENTSFSFSTNGNSAAYQYYKLQITATKGATFMQLSEMAFDYTVPGEIKAIDGTEGNGGQNYTNLFDGKKSSLDWTKWCVEKSAAYVVAKVSEPVMVTGYTLTTGNDNTTYGGRNPKSWTLYGCNDYSETSKSGGTWEIIDSVTNDSTMQDKDCTSYSFSCEDNTKYYKYYKFDITACQSGSTIQLCELEFSYIFNSCEHKWEEVSRKDSTCSEAGYVTRHCTVCGLEDTSFLPLLDHTWNVASEKAATCFESGYINKHCTVCDLKDESVLLPLGHTKGENNLCARCGKEIIRIENTYYFDLHEAINAAQPNDTIEILCDIPISSALSITTNNLTLELNGFTVKQIGSDRLINVNSSKTFTVKDSSAKKTGTLTGGTAPGSDGNSVGGGVYVGEHATFNMIGGTISGCSAYASGGGIYVHHTAKLNMSGSAVIKDCTVSNLHGGGIMNYGTAAIRDSKIINCKAYTGGGIYTESMYGNGKLDLYNSVIEGCSATMNGGGGIAAEKAAVTLNENTVIQNNSNPNNYGGGILATEKAAIEINNSTIKGNTANEGGGILANLGSTVKLLNNSEVSGNTASSSGGGIQLSNSTLIIENGSINNNTASVDGGGVYAINKSNITFTLGEINNNNAMWGGGVYLHKGSGMTISGESCYISNNTAKRNGGGIIINDASGSTLPTLTMTGGTVSFNKSTGTGSNGGGGICGQNKAVINISGGSVSSNMAANGGGVYLFDGSKLNFSGGDISANIAKSGNGGGINIYNDTNSLNLSGGSIIDNHAIGPGGGIYNNSSTLKAENDPHVTGNYISKYIVNDDGSGYAEPQSSSNLYLTSGKKISGSLKEVVAPPMIYVTLADKSQDITEAFETDCSAYIHSDDENYAVIYDEETKTHKLAESVRITLIEIEGNEESVRHEYAAKGSVYTPSYEPWRSGYRFLGWYKDGKEYDFTQPVSEPITLTAKWADDSKTAIYLTSDKYIVTGSADSAIIYIASYNGKGKLIGALTLELTENNREMFLRKLNLTTDGATTIKAFLWGANSKPLCKNAVKTLN